MFQDVCQKCGFRSIGTVFVYEKCAPVLFGQGIAF